MPKEGITNHGDEVMHPGQTNIKNTMTRILSVVAVALVAAPRAVRAMGAGHMNHSSDAGDSMPLDFLPDLAVCVSGNWPLFKTEMASDMASGGASHAMTVMNYTMYMPNSFPGRQMPMNGMAMACPEDTIDATSLLGLPETVFCAQGMYPLYKTTALAVEASPTNASHEHAFGNFTLFMPNGVSMIHRTNGECDGGWDDQSAALVLALGTTSHHGGDGHHGGEHGGEHGAEEGGNSIEPIPIIIGFAVVTLAIATAIGAGLASGKITWCGKGGSSTAVISGATSTPNSARLSRGDGAASAI